MEINSPWRILYFMGSGQGKDRETQNYWNTQSQQAYQATAQATPLQQAFEQAQLDFLNWDKSSGKNVAEAPGLDNYIQIGRAAQERGNREKMGTGALALGGAGAEGYAPKLKELRQAESEQNFGTGLEDALAMRRSEATGSVIPLASLNNARNAGRAQFAGGMYGTLQNRPRTGFWNSFSNNFGSSLGQGLGHILSFGTGAAAGG